MSDTTLGPLLPDPSARAATSSIEVPHAVFLRTWILRNGVAELLGITLAAGVAIALAKTIGEPDTLGERLLVYGSMLAAGAIEGLLLGLAQATLLQRCLPGLSIKRFALATSLVALLAWAIGMAAPTFGPPGPKDLAPAEPSMALVVFISAAGGALGGLFFAFAQWFELRRHLRSPKAWIFASMLGWGIALPIDMIGAMVPDQTTPLSLVIGSAATFGLSAGVIFAIPTGLVALRMLYEGRARALYSGAHNR